MSKYFARYSYDVSQKVPRGDGLGWSYESSTEEDSCIFEMDEDMVDISNVRQYIYDHDLKWLLDSRPDVYKILILTLNKL